MTTRLTLAVICLPSVDGGGLAVLQDLHRFAVANSQHDWVFVVGSQELAAAPHVEVVNLAYANTGARGRLTAEVKGIPATLKRVAPDAILSLQNLRVVGGGDAQWVYLHQPLPYTEHRFSLFKRRERSLALRQIVQGALIRRATRKASGVFVQTEWMRTAVLADVGAAQAERIVTVGFPHTRSPRATGPRELGSDFFYPAGPAFYKNFTLLHAASRRVHALTGTFPSIVLTLTEDEFRDLAEVPADASVDGFTFLGRISPAEVDRRYETSVLLFPSYVETLGLPLLEARAAGSHVIAADWAFTREALHGYDNAVFVGPFDVEALAAEMIAVMRGDVEVSAADAADSLTEVRSSWEKAVALIESSFREVRA